MSVQINIAGTIIDLPSSGASPNWAPSIIEAFQAIADAMGAVAGPFDVPPQIIPINAYNPGTSIDLPAASFPITDVRSVELIYSVARATTSVSVVEQGTIKAVYDASAPNGEKWEVIRFGGDSDASIDFTFLDNGQVQFSTEALPGANHQGIISYQAKALLQAS